MTITIKATDINGDGKGVDVASYLSAFESTFKPTGRGQFSGPDSISGKEYAMTATDGYGVILTAETSAPWSYSMTTHTVTGSLDTLRFGSDTQLDTSARAFTQATELSISGLDLGSAEANVIRASLSTSSAEDVIALLKADTLTFHGSTGEDTFKAFDRNDALSGGAGDDRLYGEVGNDTLSGGSGADRLYGGAGNDQLAGGSGNDTLSSGAGNDRLAGGSGNDQLTGASGNDVLQGDAGNDHLDGGAGADILSGGAGADDLYGGSGKDVFVFSLASDSTVASRGRDTIFDLGSGDRIDLREIDADRGHAGNQAFSFIGTKAFSGDAGELRTVKKASDTFIYGDLDGDKTADFAVHLDDAISLKSGYFLL
jgi:Ca2+-binding RTX toxin-like protein